MPETVWFVLHRLSDLHKVPWKDAGVVKLISAASSSKAHFLMACRILGAQADVTSWARKQSQPEKGMEKNGELVARVEQPSVGSINKHSRKNKNFPVKSVSCHISFENKMATPLAT